MKRWVVNAKEIYLDLTELNTLNSEFIDYGIVGLGKMGLLHMSILNSFSKTRLLAVCDKSSIVRRFAKNLLEATEVVGDVGELSGLDLDLVYVTTPIPAHYPVLRKILEENISDNVFVEKTLASSFSEAEELSDLSQSIKGKTMVGFQKRFSGSFRKAKDLISGGRLGELESFQAYTYSSDFLDEESSEPEARGGVLRDLGAHAIDLALWFFGRLEVKPSTVEAPETNADSLRFEVSGPEGLSGRFEISWSEPGYRMPEVGFSVWGSEGKLRVKDGVIELGEGSEITSWQRPDFWDPPGYLLGRSEFSREDEHFLQKIRGGGEPLTSFQRVMRVERIISSVGG